LTREIEPYKQLILLALDRLERNIPASKEEFLQSEVLQDAALLQLLQVGENLARIRDLAPTKFDEAPESWNRIVGLRNLIAHEYWKVDPNRIWRYLEQDLSEFRLTIVELES
jgi:uncharacterized protein with HEPN domain